MFSKIASLFTRRVMVLLLAGFAVALLAWWQWAALGDGDNGYGTGTGVQTVSWRSDTLSIAGQAAAGSPVTFTLDSKTLNTTADESGAFRFEVKAEQRSPTRAAIQYGDSGYALLLIKLQGRWIALSKAETGPAATSSAKRAWGTQARLFQNTALSGIATLSKDDAGYVFTMIVPENSTAYVYADRRLTGISKQGDALAPRIGTLPANTTQARVDIFDDTTQLVGRLRLTLPPGEDVARYTLNDGDVWIFTDPANQKAETDETYPGQFVPVKEEAIAQPAAAETATAAEPQNTDAQLKQSAPAR